MRGKRLAQLSVSVVALALLAAGAMAAGSETSPRTAVVHPDLLSQLQANPTGGLTAIVTAWGRDGLADIRKAGVVGAEGRVLPMVITSSLTLAQLNKLKASPAVRSVWPEQRYETYMEDTTWITKARYVWSTSAAPAEQPGLGTTGAGVELAMIDTGFDGLHEDGDNLVEFCDGPENPTADRFLVRCTPWVSTYNIAPAGACGLAFPGPSNSGPGPTNAPPGCSNKARGDSRDPDVSHGTHVGGTILGTGDATGGKSANHSTTGMAPDAKFHAYKAGSATLLNTATLAAYDDMTYKKEQGYTNVVAVNNSWGGGAGANYDSSDPIAIAIKRAYDAGIVSVFAAGNSGPEHNTLSSQCVVPYVVCVAASTKPDSVVMFSSRGRPSQPADTNRDGVIDAADVPPDNHDRALGQKLELGLYRPTLTAPGVNINSMKAVGANIGNPDAALCREDAPDALPRSNCYTLANGTSMATPHVTGAIGLIVQGYRQGHNGKTPTPAEIIDILERSANTSKLPANEAEEQGTGRLDAYEAVRFARSYPNGLRRPNIGHPTPPFQQGQYGKGANAPTYLEKGCTKPLSWTVANPGSTLDPVGQPPTPGVLLPRYGQHFITVPTKTERLRITVRWPDHPLANLYIRLWRPGVNPDLEFAGPGQARVYPDQEAVGLVFTGDERWIDVRSPEQTDVQGEGSGAPPAIPSGKWVLRVYHRANGAPLTCDTASQEDPKQVGDGYNYNVHVELATVTHQPSVKIDAPAPGTTVSDRFVEIRGRAGYPPDGANDPPRIGSVGHSWEGVTNWEVPGSGGSPGSDENGEPDPNNPRPVLYMHGKADEGCLGNGEADVVGCNGPFLLKKSVLAPGAPAFWRTGIDDELFDGTSDRSIHDPNWSWCLAPGPGCARIGGDVPLPGPTTVGGAMTVEWWAQCNLCGGLFSADWIIRVWGDGALKLEQRVTATPPDLSLPGRLVKTVTVPTFTATQRIVVHIDPVYVDSQTVTNIYYDSDGAGSCTPVGGRCDSLVRMPVGTTGSAGGGGVAAPDNVRVTDLPLNAPYPAAPDVPALRVAWDPRQGAGSYEVYRSTDPVDLGRRVFRGAGTACTSPEAPAPEPDDAWPGHDRAGLCFTDKGVSLRTTYYYRVFSVGTNGQKGEPSEVAYGTPTKYDRQVKVKVDRLYGPQYWEYALLEPSPNPTKDDTGTQWRYLWDTLELTPLQHLIFARSFTQGIGSPKDQTNVIVDGGGGGSTPSCEVKVTQGGWIVAANGDRSTFGGNARSDALGNASGQQQYQDHGPAQPMNVHSINVLLITCSQDRKTAHITGTATIDGQGVHQFQIDVTDNGEPGTNDVYHIRLSNRYDSGFQRLQGGNVQIH